MGTQQELTTKLPAILGTLLEARLAEVVEVRPTGLRGDWEVIRGGSEKAFLFRGDRESAIDGAVELLCWGAGGEIQVMNHFGKVAERAWVPTQAVTSRSEILQRGRATCECGSLVTPASAQPYDVPGNDLEFTVALWHVWSAQLDRLSARIDTGLARQYGPYLIVSKYGRFALEEYESTAAAMRRLVEFAYSAADDPRRPLRTRTSWELARMEMRLSAQR
jgi:hypothetical protein